MNITSEQLAQCWDTEANISTEQWARELNPAMEVFQITTPERQAAFMAQIGHESGRGRWVKEMWGPTSVQAKYEGRADLGNIQPGDGKRYMGRGLIQITGRSNYVSCRDGLCEFVDDVPDFEAHPEILELPKWAAHSAAWFWAAHGLNELADKGSFTLITRRINGGLTGIKDRMELWEFSKAALGVVVV